MSFSPVESTGTTPIFLLEIDFFGVTYRFSEIPIDLTFDGGYKNYNNLLREFSYSESHNLIGVDIEGNSVSCAVVFDGLDVVKEWRKGYSLEGQKAELSYVLEEDGAVLQTYENRVVLFVGTIQSPVFGDPLESVGFASFSVEKKPYDFSRTLIKSEHTINAATFLYHDEDTAGGKSYPIVIGQPGHTLNEWGTLVQLYATPAYMSRKQIGNYHFLIAGHKVHATQVKIRDQATNIATFSVSVGLDANGQEYSYVDVTGSDLAYPGKTLFADSGDVANVSEWWVYWGGGGMLNPFGSGFLEGGGDVCRWALLRSGVEVDYGAWGNIAGILNGYKFAGYINDPEATAWDWLSTQIIPYLPIEVKAGQKGIKPILALFYASRYITPTHKIKADELFIQTGPLETMRDTSDLLNSVTIKWGKAGSHDAFCFFSQIGPVSTNNSQHRDDVFSLMSENRYGLYETTIETEYIYDRDSAFQIAHTMVRANAFPMIQIRYDADNKYGYINVGDMLEFTDENLYFEGVKACVLAKQWQGSTWGYIIGVENTALLLPRYTG